MEDLLKKKIATSKSRRKHICSNVNCGLSVTDERQENQGERRCFASKQLKAGRHSVRVHRTCLTVVGPVCFGHRSCCVPLANVMRHGACTGSGSSLLELHAWLLKGFESFAKHWPQPPAYSFLSFDWCLHVASRWSSKIPFLNWLECKLYSFSAKEVCSNLLSCSWVHATNIGKNQKKMKQTHLEDFRKFYICLINWMFIIIWFHLEVPCIQIE